MIRALKLLLILIAVLIPVSTIAQESVIKISEDLEIMKISENTYLHISYFDLENTDHFPANGMIYVNNDRCILIDTPWTNKETEDLISWLKYEKKLQIDALIVTHWHQDCMGGLEAIRKAKIRSYANKKTIEIAREKNMLVPDKGFSDSLTLNLGDKKVLCRFPGGGHSVDNIVIWIPDEKILYAGCIVKPLNWKSLGFLGDADINSWPGSLKTILIEFPDSEIVIPGHGKPDGLNMIHHTLDLLAKHK